MGIMVSKDDENSELDRRISADLRARAQSDRRHDPDYVDDSTMSKIRKRPGASLGFGLSSLPLPFCRSSVLSSSNFKVCYNNIYVRNREVET